MKRLELPLIVPPIPATLLGHLPCDPSGTICLMDLSEPPTKRALPDPRERLILALDFPSSFTASTFLDSLQRHCLQPPLWVKVGLQLFLAEGPALVQFLREKGYSIFLDLKLHDIPNTVASAIGALASLDVDLLTVHASGGPAMLSAAAEAANAWPRPPKLLAVTVLTSMDSAQLAAVGIHATPQEHVLQLAHAAFLSGIHGVVASPLEAALLRSEFGPDLHLVTPGIRLAAGQAVSSDNDQSRVATPSAALRAGADQMVIGRPITAAADPIAAYGAILSEILEAEVQLTSA